MTRSLLLHIPQSPMDPASGAALSERTTCETLAAAGWRVRVVATTSTEGHGALSPLDFEDLSGVGFRTEIRPGISRPVWEATLRDVGYQLLETSDLSPNEARVQCSRDLDTLVSREVSDNPPDLFLTYGSDVRERNRRACVRRLGVRIVFSLRNLDYGAPEAFAETDFILTASRYVGDHCRRTHNVQAICLPVAITIDRVVSERREPTFFTFINPSWAKGAPFMAHVMKECMLRWPTIPFLIVESRGTAAGFIRCLHDAGVASDQVSRILIAKNTPEMKKVYAITKVALVPSFVEPAGRVPVEAMLNGIPVVASNRGGLPEAMGDGGFVLPVWEDSTHSEHRVAIQRWAEQIGRLFEDEAFYADACERASRHVEPYRNGKVEQQRLETFEALARSR